MGFLFGRRKPQEKDQKEHMAQPMCSSCTNHNIHFRKEDKTMFGQATPVARIDVNFNVDEPNLKNVYEHDLLTFDIHPDDVSLLNALYLDVAKHNFKDNSYPGPREKYEWLQSTHAYSARLIDENMFRRWGDLVSSVYGRTV